MAAGDLTTLANLKAWQSPPLATTADDALLVRLVTAASRFILNYLERPTLSAQLYTEIVDGPGGDTLLLRQWPAMEIASVTIDGLIVPEAATTPSQGWSLEAWDGWGAGRPQRLSLAGYRFVRGRQNVSVSYTAGYCVAGEAQLVPPDPGPYTVATNRFWAGDNGVRYAGGNTLTAVAATPAQGQYVPPVSPGGTYVFAAADAGAAVQISYSYIPDDIQQACIELVSLRYGERSRIGQVSKSLAGEVVSFAQKDMQADVVTVLQPYRRILAQ